MQKKTIPKKTLKFIFFGALLLIFPCIMTLGIHKIPAAQEAPVSSLATAGNASALRSAPSDPSSEHNKESASQTASASNAYSYSEEMYRELTGNTKLPDNWKEELEKLMNQLSEEDAMFQETDQTDDGTDEVLWNPPNALDPALYHISDSPAETMTTPEQALQAALARIGYPYSQPRRDSGIAYDCSSLVYWSYLDAGVNLDPTGNHTAASIAEYLIQTGRELKSGDLQPGDLVFYSYKQNGRYKNISHVAIIASDKTMIHASSESGYVTTKNFSLKKAVAIARPVLEEATPSNAEALENPDDIPLIDDLAEQETDKEPEEFSDFETETISSPVITVGEPKETTACGPGCQTSESEPDTSQELP